MKESKAFKVMDMAGECLITHDDRLLIRAQKSDIGLEADWKSQVDITYQDGRKVVVSYLRSDDDGGLESISVEKYESLSMTEAYGFRPQYLRGLELAEGVTVSLKNNQVDLRICNLMDDWRSRYRMALEYMVELTERGVIKYRPTTEGDERNKVEAIRNRLKRYGRPTEYEHDILFRGELGRQVMADLKAHAVHIEGDATYYLQGYNRNDDTRLSVKYYDIGHREGTGDGEYFKLETTLLKEYFKANKLTVAALTEQPDIQELIADALTKTLTKVIGYLSWGVQSMMAQALSLDITDKRKAPAALARAMLRSERTLTERVAALERDMVAVKRQEAEHDKRIAALERQRVTE